MSGHEIVWEFDGDTVRASVECHEPEGADCRLTGGDDCACESWTIQRDPDGKPFHLVETYDGDIRHENESTNYCNVVEFLEAEFNVAELCADRYAHFVIARTPITPEWTGDGYGWMPILEGVTP